MSNKIYQGPDISTHNGNVDIKRVRDAGYKRASIIYALPEVKEG